LVIAALIVVAAFALRRLMVFCVGAELPPFVTFYPSIMIAALLCGFWPGVLATGLSSLLAHYLLLSPFRQVVAIGYPSDVVALASFASMGIFMSWVGERYRRKQAEVAAYKEEQALREGEKQVRKSEEQFEILANAIPQLCWIADSDGQGCWWNQRWYEYTGTTLEQMRSAGWQSVLDPAEAPEALEQWRITVESGEALPETILRMRGADGVFRPFLVRAVPVKDAQGKVTRWFGTNTDLSAQKKIEEALRLSEARFRSVLDNSRDIIYQFNVQTKRYEYMSPCVEQILGYSPAEMLAITPEEFLALVYPDDRPVLLEAFLQLEAKGEGEVEIRFKVKSGAYRCFSSRMQLTRDGAGWPLYRYGNIRDVTEQKWAEDALRESEERLHLASKAAGFGTYSYDFQSGVGVWSREAKALLGLQAADTTSMNTDDLFWCLHPEDRPGLLAAMAAANDPSGSGLLESDHRILLPDGSIRWLHVCGRTEFAGVGDQRKPWRAAGAIVDITKLKQGDEKRNALEQQLRHAQKLESVGRLAGGIAHEFNNLLLVIQTYTELLQNSLPREDKLRAKTEQVLSATERAACLTGQLLAFSRKQMVSKVPLDLNTVIVQATNMLRRLIGEDIEFNVVKADSLWAVEADNDQMFQVLMNLCMNARDAMPQGGTLTIATENVVVGEGSNLTPGDYVRFSVTDTGIGIRKEIQQQIFEPFFTTKEVGKGTGLGLATVYGIVQQSGGQVTVDSEVGHGACFAVYLPKAQRAFTLGETLRTEALQRGTGTVLVVEDEEFLRKGIAEFLGSLGYTVLMASSGEEALVLASEQEHIDLLLTDVVMPKMSGRELSEILRARRPGLKVIHMSGYTDDALLLNGSDRPHVTFLQKPFGLATLARKVRETLDDGE
jgi:PAS domain S-box-containing protein